MQRLFRPSQIGQTYGAAAARAELSRYLATAEQYMPLFRKDYRTKREELYHSAVVTVTRALGGDGSMLQDVPKLSEYKKLEPPTVATYNPNSHAVEIDSDFIYRITALSATGASRHLSSQAKDLAMKQAQQAIHTLNETLVHELVHAARRESVRKALADNRLLPIDAEEAVASFAQSVITGDTSSKKIYLHSATAIAAEEIARRPESAVFGYLIGHAAALSTDAEGDKGLGLMLSLVKTKDSFMAMCMILQHAYKIARVGFPSDSLLGGDYVRNHAPDLIEKFGERLKNSLMQQTMRN